MQHRTIALQKQEREITVILQDKHKLRGFVLQTIQPRGKVIAKNNPLILYIEGKLLFLQTFI